ncbi:hypothetical protein [Streptomyces sp. NPDC056663]|uniref:hypothetical protein n=1 Tax=Streptomyces sp. NPDC056663 TaxID=3345899 RepID=UPI0036C1F42A
MPRLNSAEGGVPADLNASLRISSSQAFPCWIQFKFTAQSNPFRGPASAGT